MFPSYSLLHDSIKRMDSQAQFYAQNLTGVLYETFFRIARYFLFFNILIRYFWEPKVKLGIKRIVCLVPIVNKALQIRFLGTKRESMVPTYTLILLKSGIKQRLLRKLGNTYSNSVVYFCGINYP